MSYRRKHPFFAAIALLAAWLLPAAAQAAESWPQRTVKLVVPLGPASGADVTARLVADQLSRRWGQAVIVENRPGADGLVGVNAFIAGADDHALLFAPTGTFTASPLIHPNVPYKPDGLAPIARATTTVIAIGVPGASKAGSLGELVAMIKSQPGRLHWASTTGATDLVFSGFLRSAGLDMVRVPYRDGVLATNDLSEGRIEAYMSAVTTMQALAAAGKVRMLALSNRRRAPTLPGIPTVLEAGYPGLQYDGLAGMFATTAMPRDQRERIAADVREVITDPAIAAKIEVTGQLVNPGGPDEFAAAIAEQAAAFHSIARALGLNP